MFSVCIQYKLDLEGKIALVFIFAFKNFFPYVLNSLQKNSFISSRYMLIDIKDQNIFNSFSEKFTWHKFLDSCRTHLAKTLLS